MAKDTLIVFSFSQKRLNVLLVSEGPLYGVFTLESQACEFRYSIHVY